PPLLLSPPLVPATVLGTPPAPVPVTADALACAVTTVPAAPEPPRPAVVADCTASPVAVWSAPPGPCVPAAESPQALRKSKARPSPEQCVDGLPISAGTLTNARKGRIH